MIHPTAVIGEPPQDRNWGPHDHSLGVMIEPTARIGPLTVIDNGTQIPTQIGAFTWVMCQVHIAHDCIIGREVEIAPHATLLGFVRVGDRTKIGGGATILPFRTIGADCVIGAGAVVTQNVPDGETWAGNPARKLDGRNPVPFSEREAAELELLDHARGGQIERALDDVRRSALRIGNRITGVDAA